VHIEESEPVWIQASDRNRPVPESLVLIFCIEVWIFWIEIHLIGKGFSSVAKWGCRSGSATVFPFPFIKQAVPTSELIVQASNKLLAVVPGDLLNWKVGFALEMAGIGTHDIDPNPLGNLMDCDPERFGHVGPIQGEIGRCMLIFGAAGHGSRGDQSEPHPQAVTDLDRQILFTRKSLLSIKRRF
jgi:hypothetical protein